MTTEDRDLVLPELDDRVGPAAPIAEGDARRMVRAAMAQPESRLPISGRWARVLLFAAVLALLGATALALTGGLRSTPRVKPLAPMLAPPATTSPPLPLAPSPAPLDVHHDVATASSTPHALSAPHPSGPIETIDEMLARANSLRGEKRWSEAAETYEHIARVAPDAPAAQAARIAAAELRLDQLGDPRRAEQGFLEAQRRGGSLSEEASWGLARARRARGDEAGERATLQQFLERFPGAAMAPRARARLAEIAPAP